MKSPHSYTIETQLLYSSMGLPSTVCIPSFLLDRPSVCVLYMGVCGCIGENTCAHFFLYAFLGKHKTTDYDHSQVCLGVLSHLQE